MEQSLRQALTAGKRLVADGATGTMLMAAGLPAGMTPELWNVDRPDQILALHRAYLDAGSNIILTNSFGATRLKLSKSGLGERAHELNLVAARLAKEAAAGQAFVAGDIGPTGELMKPMGTLTYEAALETFAEQAAALVEGGADLLWIETMSDLNEAKAAVVGALQAAPGIPVFATLSFGKKARTMMGTSARQAAETLWPLGLSAIGLNCGEGLEMVPEVLRQMREAAPDAVLIAKPNAGLPRLEHGETVYDVTPQDFAQHMAEFEALGAKIIGSCCGSSPAYIKSLVG